MKYIITVDDNNSKISVQCGTTVISGTDLNDVIAEAGALCAEISRDIGVGAAGPDDADEAEAIYSFLLSLGV